MSRIIEIASGRNTAAISTLAASLVGLTLGSKTPIPRISQGSKSYAGEALAPWPNRIAGGKYSFDEVDYEVAPSDGLGNALHGLLHEVEAEVVEERSDSVQLEFQIEPSSSYPGRIQVLVNYRISEQGLEVLHTAINNGGTAAPVGLGTHPYFVVSESSYLFVPAGEVARREPSMISNHQDELSSIGMSANRATKVSELELDHEFSKFRKSEGLAKTYLLDADGSGIQIWQLDVDYQMIYTSPGLNFDSGVARAIAIEPQTCAVDAFNNHKGLSIMKPGESLVLNWGVSVVEPEVGRVYL